MKKKYFLPIVLVTLLATGCTKEFLNRDPLDTVDDSNFWGSESNLRLHSIYYYSDYFRSYGQSWTTAGEASYTEYNTDIIAKSSGIPGTAIANGNYSSGTSAVNNGGGKNYSAYNWSTCYTWIRRANTFIERVENRSKGQITEEAYNHWLGVAKFLRAYMYSELVWGFGNVPYYDKVTDDMAELCKDRDDRYMIIDKIIDDFQAGVTGCRADDGGNNLLNKYSIAAIGARYMYWLGNFQKYAPEYYQGGNQAYATKCLQKAVDWTTVVMQSGKYDITTDYRSEYASDNLKDNKGVILARFYKAGQVRHVLTTYQNLAYFDQFGGSPTAHYVRNMVLFWDGQLEPSKTTVIANAGDPANYGKLYTQVDNALFINKDPRLEAQLQIDTKITAPQNLAGAMTGNYFGTGTRYYPRTYFPREYEDLPGDYANAGGGGTVDFLRSTNNVTNYPCVRYAEVLLTYIAAKAEISVSSVTQADIDNTINKLRARPIANATYWKGKNPSPCTNQLASLTLGSYPDDPERDLEGIDPLMWEIRRERAVELTYDYIRARDLRAWGLHIAYQQRYDNKPGKYCTQASDPGTGYNGQYNGGSPATGWGYTDMTGKAYFSTTKEGNLMQCGAYFEMDVLYDKWVAAWDALQADPQNTVKISQETQYRRQFNTFNGQYPNLWVVKPDGSNIQFPNYRLGVLLGKQGADAKKFFSAAAPNGPWSTVVDDATARAAMEKMHGWYVMAKHILSDYNGNSDPRLWLGCLPIQQIMYYKTLGYTLTQNPGYATEI